MLSWESMREEDKPLTESTMTRRTDAFANPRANIASPLFAIQDVQLTMAHLSF